MINIWIKEKLSLWLVDAGESFWYVASCSNEALNIHYEIHDYHDEYETKVTRIPDTDYLKVDLDDGNPPVEKTAKEWCKEGKGLIAASVW